MDWWPLVDGRQQYASRDLSFRTTDSCQLDFQQIDFRLFPHSSFTSFCKFLSGIGFLLFCLLTLLTFSAIPVPDRHSFSLHFDYTRPGPKNCDETSNRCSPMIRGCVYSLSVSLFWNDEEFHHLFWEIHRFPGNCIFSFFWAIMSSLPREDLYLRSKDVIQLFTSVMLDTFNVFFWEAQGGILVIVLAVCCTSHWCQFYSLWICLSRMFDVFFVWGSVAHHLLWRPWSMMTSQPALARSRPVGCFPGLFYSASAIEYIRFFVVICCLLHSFSDVFLTPSWSFAPPFCFSFWGTTPFEPRPFST